MTKNKIQYSEDIVPYSRDELIEKVRRKMSNKRFQHVLRVEDMSLILARKNNESLEKASIAALVHDYGKERPNEDYIELIKDQYLDANLLKYGNAIWHGLLGSYFIKKELQITDEEILQAVRVHTTGAAEMSRLDCILYVADYVEVGRQFSEVDKAREIAMNNLDEAVSFETEQTLLYLIQKKALVYPKTLETYNAWVAK